MSPASEDLYAFIFSAVRGICDYQDKVHIEIVETPPKTTTLYVSCHESDLRFVYSKIKEMKIISIAIAQRHRVIVNIVVND